MRIKKYFKNKKITNNHYVNNIKDDSRLVEENDVYFCCEKSPQKAKTYIEEAISKGAKTIVSTKSFSIKTIKNINYILTNSIYQELSRVVKMHYHRLLKNIKFIGISGTNGKTTVTSIIFRYLQIKKINSILIGTNGYFYKKLDNTVVNIPLPNTTPNILKIINIIKKAKLSKGYCIMEVSSQAIMEHRILGLEFYAVGFTRITQDHLDYHKTIGEYVNAKRTLLFQVRNDGFIVLNDDCKHYEKLINQVINPVISYGKSNKLDSYKYQLLTLSNAEMSFEIEFHNRKYCFVTNLLGEYNVENITLAFVLIKSLNIDTNLFSEFIKTFEKIPGRQNIINCMSRKVVIDFAHTPSAFSSVLKTFNSIKTGKIITVFGCGGNRDKSKRPLMGKIASLYSDHIILTNDNPRTESENNIINDIAKGIKNKKYEIITNRYEAIKEAFKISCSNDTILILGKGSEKGTIDNDGLSDEQLVKKYIEGVR